MRFGNGKKQQVFCKGCKVRLKHPYVALSRFDNKSAVCPECGVFEAMTQFSGKALRFWGDKGLA